MNFKKQANIFLSFSSPLVIVVFFFNFGKSKDISQGVLFDSMTSLMTCIEISHFSTLRASVQAPVLGAPNRCRKALAFRPFPLAYEGQINDHEVMNKQHLIS